MGVLLYFPESARWDRDAFVSPAERDARVYRQWPRAFYLQDGSVEWHQVDNPPRLAWSVMERLDDDVMLTPWPSDEPKVLPRRRVINCTRRDYAYAYDFIGPHRLSDYHECCPGCGAWPDYPHERGCPR